MDMGDSEKFKCFIIAVALVGVGFDRNILSSAIRFQSLPDHASYIIKQLELLKLKLAAK